MFTKMEWLVIGLATGVFVTSAICSIIGVL